MLLVHGGQDVSAPVPGDACHALLVVGLLPHPLCPGLNPVFQQCRAATAPVTLRTPAPVTSCCVTPSWRHSCRATSSPSHPSSPRQASGGLLQIIAAHTRRNVAGHACVDSRGSLADWQYGSSVLYTCMVRRSRVHSCACGTYMHACV